jgi:hypothetical protein
MTEDFAKNRCRRCGYAITWSERRRQFGRVIRKGLTPDATKELMPLCQKCCTVECREMAARIDRQLVERAVAEIESERQPLRLV